MILHRSVSGGSTTRVSCLQTQTHILLLLSSILGPWFSLPAPHISLHCQSIHTVITAGLETCPWYDGPSESRCLGRSKRCQVWRLIFKVFMATAPIKRTRCSKARPCSGGGRRVTAADGRISTQQLSGQRGAAPHRCTQTGLLLHLLGYVMCYDAGPEPVCSWFSPRTGDWRCRMKGRQNMNWNFLILGSSQWRFNWTESPSSHQFCLCFMSTYLWWFKRVSLA